MTRIIERVVNGKFLPGPVSIEVFPPDIEFDLEPIAEILLDRFEKTGSFDIVAEKTE